MSENQLRATLSRRPWLIEGPLSIAVTPYLKYLRVQRYSEHTVYRYVASVAHFAYWMRAKGFELSSLDEAVVKQFLQRHLPCCKCPKPCCHCRQDLMAAIRHLLIVLRHADLLRAPIEESTPVAVELEEFHRYLCDTCGLGERTCHSRLEYIHKFLLHHFGKGQVNISQLTVKDIDSYVIDYAKRLSHSSVSTVGSTLKAYLRFRASRGDQTQSLLAAVPHIANWSRTTIPKILTEGELERVLQMFDVTTPMGQRNYAIARCLADLGLRSIEVASLSLNSLDWREATVTVSCGKGRRKLPLSRRTGRSIVRYLRHGRPKTSNRQLFVRHRPPYDEPITACAIQKVIRRVFDRCNVDKNLGAAHALRRTLATRLQQSGASLKEIADLLGHQDLQTTTIYAKVDVHGLRKMALPWPGSSS